MTLRRFAILGLGLLMSSCATAALSGYLLDPEGSPHQACPPDRFLVAAASSPAGRAEAEARARSEIARRIASRLEVEIQRVAELSLRDGTTTSQRSLRE
ncbi:MAG: hypothetical protein HY901_24940, partial [Deltaproteobacteria bacterium]|nr:hypothetical protein [Deltaproteobacteria bacterium]